MIFQPVVVALLVASAMALAGTVAAVPHAWGIVRRWDRNAGEAIQLRLERRTPLFSAGVALLLAGQAAGLLLFVAFADRSAERVVGAMCAVGVLRADPWGFPALGARIVAFFAASVWLVLDAVDRRARDYPFTRAKFGLLLGLVPLLSLSLGLELSYFRGLRPDVITSCCSSLFSPGAPAVAGELAEWPPGPTLVGAAAIFAIAITTTGIAARTGRGGAIVGAAGVAAFAAGLVAVVVVVSPYVYEHPGHHCPFCLLKGEYGGVGWALYVPLFSATASAAGAAALALLRPGAGEHPETALLLERAIRRLSGLAAAGYLLFCILAAGRIAASGLVLLTDA